LSSIKLEQIVAGGKWDPALLPLSVKLATHVTFEFIDTSLEEACQHFRDMTGLEFELDERLDGLTPQINLRVTDMEAALGFDWVMRLCDLNFTTERGKVRVAKDAPEEPPTQ